MGRSRAADRSARSSRRSIRVILGALGLVVALEGEASACGAAYPGGPMVCTMEDAPGRKARAASMPIARVFASYAFTSTTILFGEGRRAELTRHAVFAGTELPLASNVALRFGAGGIAAGELGLPGDDASLGPGATAFFGAAWTALAEREAIPFVQIGATLSASRAATRLVAPGEAPSFSAFDLRAAGTVGKTIARVLVPYVSLRAFGGPVYYRIAGADVTGTDLYKYQVAGGLALSLPSRVLDVFVEGVPLGESGMSAGVGTTF